VREYYGFIQDMTADNLASNPKGADIYGLASSLDTAKEDSEELIKDGIASHGLLVKVIVVGEYGMRFKTCPDYVAHIVEGTKDETSEVTKEA